MSKFTKQLDGFLVVGEGRSFGSVESADVDERILKSYTRPPRSISCDFWTERYALIFSSLLCLFVISAVGQILAHRAWTKVLVSIIQAIAVDVINMWAVTANYFSVHPYDWCICGLGIVALPSSVIVGNPVCFGQAFVTTSRYYRALSLREWNIPARFAVNVYNPVAYDCPHPVKAAPPATLSSFGLYVFSAVRANFVFVGALFGWCKIGLRLGNSFQRAHVPPRMELCGSGRTFFSIPEMRVA